MNHSHRVYSGRLSKKESDNSLTESSYESERDAEFKKELKKAQDSIEVLGMKRRSTKAYSIFHKKSES